MIEQLTASREDHPSKGDRPSDHGAALGRHLAAMVEAGGGADTCSTCAFREGAMANVMAGTGLIAMTCAMGTDPADFGCHHGMQNGEPTKMCVGWLAAQKAPFEKWKAGMIKMLGNIQNKEGPDAIRDDFDRWWPTVDPEGKMDVYQLGREWAKRKAKVSADDTVIALGTPSK